MKYDIKNRCTGKPVFTCNIDCPEDALESLKLRLELIEAVKCNTNLTGANLSWVNLSWVNLSWVNLTGADLSWANLRGADLTSIDLANANLTGANMTSVNLTNANLTNANLYRVCGSNHRIKSISIGGRYFIAYTHDVIQIGCEQHTHEEWRNFTKKEILKMDGKEALKWWKKHKKWLFKTIELFPAS